MEHVTQAGFFFSVAKMISALALVLGLMLVLFYLLRRTWLRSQGLGANGRLIQVLAHQMLGPKKGMAVVKVAGEYWVLGIGQEQVSMLGKIDSAQEVEALAQAAKETGGPSFTGILNSFLNSFHRQKGET